MQSMLREKLMAQSQKLSVISKTYKNDVGHFVESYFQWLEELENDIRSLRSTLSIMLQSEKTVLMSIMDGNIPVHVRDSKNSRKYIRVASAISLEKIAREMASIVNNIDMNLDPTKQQLIQAIAVLSIKDSNLYDSLSVDPMSVSSIRHKLSTTPETVQISNYICAKLTSMDINYLINDILANIVSNRI
jgi:hypothetical protein